MTFTKRRKKTRRYIRKVQGQMLRFVQRNLKQIEGLLEWVPDEMAEFREKVTKKVAVIRCLNGQQKEMWEKRVRRVENRIVSIHRSQIRPMVWGKEGKDVEFGTKVVIADQIFGTRENRLYLKAEEIGAAFKPLGRPRGQPDKKERAWMKRQQKKRNGIEGLIGTAKTRYGLERILYSIPDGKEIWARMGLMGMNLNRAVARMT